MNIINEGRGQVTLEATTEEEGKILRDILVPILRAKDVTFHQNRGGDFITFIPASRQTEVFDFKWELAKRKAFYKAGFACHACKKIAAVRGTCGECGNEMTKIQTGDFV
jgi:hypothetical protein